MQATATSPCGCMRDARVDPMTIIHECDRCNAPGRVIETSDGFRCEGCYEEAQEQVRSEASCPECGRLGVTATGICYACENT